MKKIILLTIVVLFGLQFNVLSQNVRKGKILDNWSINANGGATMFWGDVETNLKDDFRARVGYGAYIGKRLSSVFELRGEFTGGQLSGSKSSYNYYFESDFYSYRLNTTISLTGLFYGNNPCKKLNLYFIGGIGLIQYRSLLKQISDDKIIANTAFKSSVVGASQEWETEVAVPFGLGASFKLGKRVEINIENQWNIVNSDGVDAKKGGIKYDAYSYTSIGLTFKFNFHKNPAVFVSCSEYKAQKNALKIKKEPKVVKEPEKKTIPIPIEAKKENVDTLPKAVVKKVVVDATPKYEYKVQIFASKSRGVNILKEKHNITEPIREDYNGVYYRYSVGSLKKYTEALEKVKKVKAEYGIADAFVVGIRDNKRLDSYKELLADEKNASLKKLPEVNTKVTTPVNSSNYEFKVQVYSSSYKVNTAFIQKLYKINDAVREDYNGIVYRYSVGSYKKYTEANERVKKLSAENKKNDVFVVGIKDGKRLDSYKELLTDEEKATIKILKEDKYK